MAYDGLFTADSVRLLHFVFAVARIVTYAWVGKEVFSLSRITEHRRSRAGRSATADQPNRSYRSAEYGPLPLVATLCEKVNDL